MRLCSARFKAFSAHGKLCNNRSTSIAAILVFGGGVAAESSDHRDNHREIRLNDGQKWTADTHTAESIERMRVILHQAPADTDGAREVGTRLEAELQALIKGCRMTGAAHDELHVLLERLIPAIREVRAVQSARQVAGVYEEVRDVLRAYDEHFAAP